VGGSAVKTVLDDADKKIIAGLAPRLRQDGLWFVGIDVIGGKLTEVNVTSPTGIQAMSRLEGANLSANVVDWLEARASVH
jgi:glutathione synthase